MNQDPTPSASGEGEAPLTDFSNCHIGIIQNFETLKNLASNEIQANKETKATAKKLIAFFADVVLEHHSEEEEELFRTVMTTPGHDEEKEQAKQMVDQLTAEHRDLEAQWKNLAPQIKQLAKGKSVSVDRDAAMKLATDYLAHAKFEEDVFLPLSEKILAGTGMEALGLSLHMRHAKPFTAYI